MSIPRLAIQRPVTMFMISGVIILLGVMSLARLPVDLMPDVSFPSITVRVGYAGDIPNAIRAGPDDREVGQRIWLMLEQLRSEKQAIQFVMDLFEYGIVGFGVR